MVLFGQSCCNRAKVVVFGQSACFHVKVVVFGQGGCNRVKRLVFVQKLLYSGKSGSIREKWFWFRITWLY